MWLFLLFLCSHLHSGSLQFPFPLLYIPISMVRFSFVYLESVVMAIRHEHGIHF